MLKEIGGRYLLDTTQILGQGFNSTVYKGLHLHSGLQVAIKALPRSPTPLHTTLLSS
jgi:hypothetical protein